MPREKGRKGKKDAQRPIRRKKHHRKKTAFLTSRKKRKKGRGNTNEGGRRFAPKMKSFAPYLHEKEENFQMG